MKGLREFANKHIKGNYNGNDVKQHKLFFDVDNYLRNNRGYGRDEMPQIDWDEFLAILPQLRKVTSISEGEAFVTTLSPTQNEINLEKVLKKIASGKNVDYKYTYIVDKDFYILDGHHRHVRTLITDKNRKVLYVKFDDIDIDELIYMFTKVVRSAQIDIRDNVVEMLMEARESYGAQGPAAVPGMGDVAMPAVATDVGQAMNPANRGSGDIPGVHGDDDDDEKIKYQTNKPA